MTSSPDFAADSLSVFDRAATHPNPAFDFLTGFVPRKLKDLFKWCDYLVFNSAHIYAALKKFGELVITEIEYGTTNDALRRKYKDLFVKTLKIKGSLMIASLDKQVYGNHFTSIYFPFTRSLKCPTCSTLVNINHVDYKFTLRKLAFVYCCPRCRVDVTGKVVDQKVTAPDKINIIRWDPKLMDINFNPISGRSVYYYNIPEPLKEQVRKGSKHVINEMPMEFLEAIRDNQPFEFARDRIFHVKAHAPSGVEQQWGLPPLTSTIKLFLYTMILRKANEAIALEHIVPFRIIHPEITNGQNPLEVINMNRWLSETRNNLRRFRRDPLHIMFAPFQVGVTNLGGDGRAMLTLGEVQEAEKNIMAALGLPPEFLFGGLTKAGMEGNLRLIENQTQNHADDMNALLSWYVDQLSRYLGWERIDASLTPIKLIDDDANKNLLIGMAIPQEGGQKRVSMTTIYDRLGIDGKKEQELIKQEALNDMRMQNELQFEQAKMQQTLQAQVQATMQGQAGLAYDPTAVHQQAMQVAQQLAGLDDGTRRSQLHQMKTTDYVMYACVIQVLEDQQTAQTQLAKSQVEQQTGGVPGGGA